MCNPRRINITASRQLNEAWEREITRSVELIEEVQGEARVLQPLDSSLGDDTISALESSFESGQPGWEATENGYRFEIQGGYIEYLRERRALEIVALLEDTINTQGEVSSRLTGEIIEEITIEGTGSYYDDGYAGKDKDFGKKAAERDIDQKFEKEKREARRRAEDNAEEEASKEMEEQALKVAQDKLNQLSEERKAELAEQARNNLQVVGLRGRQAFHRVLAQAYKNRLLEWARNNGAENIHCSDDDDDLLEIEFTVSK